jgi:hypothetical protein
MVLADLQFHPGRAAVCVVHSVHGTVRRVRHREYQAGAPDDGETISVMVRIFMTLLAALQRVDVEAGT